MDDLLRFIIAYGWQLAIIAVVGVIILGVLKYSGAFSKITEGKRHYIYIIISVGFSVGAAAVYLLIADAFDIEYLFTVAVAMLTLNQTFYNIFKVTPINKLGKKILDFIVAFIKKFLPDSEKPPDIKNK